MLTTCKKGRIKLLSFKRKAKGGNFYQFVIARYEAIANYAEPPF